MILSWFLLSLFSLVSHCFYIPLALYFCCKFFIFLESSRLLSLSHFCLQEFQHPLTYFFFIITDYCIWFTARDGSAGLHVFIP
jgi:hypothetical protein